MDEAIKGKIDAALQKPTGLTKTKLVGVGASGQENIEIGENLTLANGKLAAIGGDGGSGIPIVEGTMNAETMVITIPEAQTKAFILHVEDLQAYVFMSKLLSGYLGYLYEGRNTKQAYVFQGSGPTTIELSVINPIVQTPTITFED